MGKTPAGIRVDESIQRRIDKMDSLARRQALHSVPLRGAVAHGRRLCFLSRGPDQVSSLAEVLLTPEGELADARCSICTRGNGYWPIGCVHTTGLVVHAMAGHLKEGEEAAIHPLLSRKPGPLRARLRRNQASDLWELSAHTLCRRYDDGEFPNAGRVGEVLADPTQREAWSPLQLQALAESMELELQARRQARKPAPWRAQPPEDPNQAAFVHAVHAELQRRAPHTRPLLGPADRHGGKLTIGESPLRVHWVSNARRCITTGGRVRHLLTYDASGVHVHTETGEPVDPSCPYAVDLLHVTLDTLAHRHTKAGQRRLASALTTPPWQQNLQQLDRVLDELGVDPTPTDVESTPLGNGKGDQLGWQVSRRSGSGWTIRAVWTRPYVRRTGLRVSEVRYSELSGQLQRLSRHDRAILQHADTHWISLHGNDAAIFRAAVGHPFLVDEQREHFAYRLGELGLALRPDSEGSLCLSFLDTTSGRDLSPDAVETLLIDKADGEVSFDHETSPPTLFAFTRASAQLLRALAQRGRVLPASARGALLTRVPALRQILPIELHPALHGQEVSPSLQPVLRLAPLASGPIEVQVRIRPLAEGPLVAPGEGPEELESVVEDERRTTRRRLSEERAAVRAALGDDADLFEAGADLQLPLDDTTLGRLQRLQVRAEAGELVLEWTGDALKVSRSAGASQMRISVGGGKDWLALGGELEIDGHSIDLQRVMEAVRIGRRFVRVDKDNWVGLTDQLRERLARLSARSRTDKRGRSTLAPLSGEVLDELAQEGVKLEVPERLSVETARLREARQTHFAAPAGLQATLRPYQTKGLQWLQRMAHWSPGACLADDMGLGKTLQALGLLLHRAGSGPALVVAPTSLASNWMAEAERFAPSLQLHSYRGPHRATLLRSLGAQDVLVTSYDILRRDVGKLGRVGFHTLVYDEAQALKNPLSQTARAAARVRGDFCLALSGTPVENRSVELWSLFRVVVPGLLGSHDWFRRQLALPADSGDALARTRLSALVAPFLLRRTKREVARELPERTEIIRRIPLSRSERRLYNAARLAGMQIREEDPRKARFAVLKALTRLRQLACDPTLVDPHSRVSSSKLEALQELVDGIVHQGAQVLVFSQWTGLLDRVQSVLKAHRCIRLDGSTPQKKRGGLVQDFQSGLADVFLISRQAGGTGLNLMAATYVIHLDPWWNPAAEDQATDRAHRIGQTQGVTVYRLIAEGTVEEGVLEMQAAKRELVDSILEGTRSRRTPSLDELLALLRGDG
jgi:hypothetical protein